VRADFKVEHVVDDAHVFVPFVAVFLVGEGGEVEVPKALCWLRRLASCYMEGEWLKRLVNLVTYVVAGLIPFDEVFRACSEFGRDRFEGDCCEADGPEDRG